jgi:phosphoserine phosphatase
MEPKYKIACFDLDGTILRNTTAFLHFAELLGVKEQVSLLEEKFYRREIDSIIFMDKIIPLMKELSTNYIDQHFETLPIIKGLDKTLKKLKNHNITTALATSSSQMFADIFKQRYDFDHAYGTSYELKPNNIEATNITSCNGDRKVLHITNLANSYGIELNRVVAIGDSLTDVPLFATVGKGIAINNDHHLEGKAHVYLKTENMYDIIAHIIEPKTKK